MGDDSNNKSEWPKAPTAYRSFYRKDCSRFTYAIGFVMASVISVAYFLTPVYSLSCLILLVSNPFSSFTWKFSSLFILSILMPCVTKPDLVHLMTPVLEYFQYEEVFEFDYPEWLERTNNGEKFIIPSHPHGVISYAGICLKIACPMEFSHVPTAVASAVMKTPILKQVMGVFSLTDVSKRNMRKVIETNGPDGTMFIYPGGIAELFKSNLKEERLYLQKRKGFVKFALQSGTDIVPLYLFGNSSVLSVLSTGTLASISRKIQASVTYFWGQWGMPFPRSGHKCMSVLGRPLGMPKIEEPTQEDIDKWHTMWLDEVRRIYEKYQEKLPEYKNKPLFID